MTTPTDSGSSFDPDAFPRRINLGCGYDHRDGYLNIDFLDAHNPDLVADVRNLSMLPDAYYDEIVAQDVLEHLERCDIDGALQEWARLTRIGGEIVLRVPDIIGVAREISNQQTVEWHSTMIHALYGTQAYNGDYHLAGFTELTLRHSLHEAGFAVTDLRRFNGWLLDCVAVRFSDSRAFDPGPLPFIHLCDPAVESSDDDASADAADMGTLDRTMTAVGGRLPPLVRSRMGRLWRPLRRLLARLGLV